MDSFVFAIVSGVNQSHLGSENPEGCAAERETHPAIAMDAAIHPY